MVVLPRIDFALPEPVTTESGGSGLSLLPSGAYAEGPSADNAVKSFDGGTLRVRLIIDAMNALFAGLNAVEPKLEWGSVGQG